jgi:hypothetical protein
MLGYQRRTQKDTGQEQKTASRSDTAKKPRLKPRWADISSDDVRKVFFIFFEMLERLFDLRAQCYSFFSN